MSNHKNVETFLTILNSARKFIKLGVEAEDLASIEKLKEWLARLLITLLDKNDNCSKTLFNSVIEVEECKSIIDKEEPGIDCIFTSASIMHTEDEEDFELPIMSESQCQMLHFCQILSESKSDIKMSVNKELRQYL